MTKLKRLIEKTKQALERVSSKKKTLRDRIQRIKESGSILSTSICEIESMRRNWRADKLINQLENKLQDSIDNENRSDLTILISFVEYLLVNGNDIPKNESELLKIFDSFSKKARLECSEYVSSANSSESMLYYAARHENPLQKN